MSEKYAKKCMFGPKSQKIYKFLRRKNIFDPKLFFFSFSRTLSKISKKTKQIEKYAEKVKNT